MAEKEDSVEKEVKAITESVKETDWQGDQPQRIQELLFRQSLGRSC